MSLFAAREETEEVLWEAGAGPEPAAGPEEVAEAFIRCVEEGDMPAIAAHLSRAVVGAVDPEVIRRNFAAGRDEIAARRGLHGLRVLARTVGRYAAALTLAIAYRDGSADTEVIALVREYGRWRIDLTR